MLASMHYIVAKWNKIISHWKVVTSRGQKSEHVNIILDQWRYKLKEQDNYELAYEKSNC